MLAFETGCSANRSCAKAGLKRQKSVSSQAESISAWKTVLDWPSMVAAFNVARQDVASSSPALRITAARSSHGQRDHSLRAAAAAAMASSTCFSDALWQSARTCAWWCGITARSEEHTSE